MLIGRIRRVLRGSDEGDPLRHIGNQLQPEALTRTPPAKEQPIGQTDESHGGVFVPGGESEVERQAEVVRAAMAQGGRFGDREIPVPWLRRILAGLEGRKIDEEAVWEGIASPPRNELVEESPTYQELFPSPG